MGWLSFIRKASDSSIQDDFKSICRHGFHLRKDKEGEFFGSIDSFIRAAQNDRDKKLLRTDPSSKAREPETSRSFLASFFQREPEQRIIEADLSKENLGLPIPDLVRNCFNTYHEESLIKKILSYIFAHLLAPRIQDQKTKGETATIYDYFKDSLGHISEQVHKPSDELVNYFSYANPDQIQALMEIETERLKAYSKNISFLNLPELIQSIVQGLRACHKDIRGQEFSVSVPYSDPKIELGLKIDKYDSNFMELEFIEGSRKILIPINFKYFSEACIDHNSEMPRNLDKFTEHLSDYYTLMLSPDSQKRLDAAQRIISSGAYAMGFDTKFITDIYFQESFHSESRDINLAGQYSQIKFLNQALEHLKKNCSVESLVHFRFIADELYNILIHRIQATPELMSEYKILYSRFNELLLQARRSGLRFTESQDKSLWKFSIMNKVVFGLIDSTNQTLYKNPKAVIDSLLTDLGFNPDELLKELFSLHTSLAADYNKVVDSAKDITDFTNNLSAFMVLLKHCLEKRKSKL